MYDLILYNYNQNYNASFIRQRNLFFLFFHLCASSTISISFSWFFLCLTVKTIGVCYTFLFFSRLKISFARSCCISARVEMKEKTVGVSVVRSECTIKQAKFHVFLIYCTQLQYICCFVWIFFCTKNLVMCNVIYMKRHAFKFDQSQLRHVAPSNIVGKLALIRYKIHIYMFLN